MSVHEAAARLRKALRLVEQIDRVNHANPFQGLPVLSAGQLARGLRDQPSEWWAQLAVLAAVRPPSAETRRQVIDHFEARAGVAGKAVA